MGRGINIIKEQKIRRSFGGKLDGFISSLEEVHEKRHLKAYLKGTKYFRHGYVTNNFGNREPNYFNVIENWNEITN